MYKNTPANSGSLQTETKKKHTVANVYRPPMLQKENGIICIQNFTDGDFDMEV